MEDFQEVFLKQSVDEFLENKSSKNTWKTPRKPSVKNPWKFLRCSYRNFSRSSKEINLNKFLEESVEKFLKLSLKEMSDKFLVKYMEEYLEDILTEPMHELLQESLEAFLPAIESLKVNYYARFFWEIPVHIGMEIRNGIPRAILERISDGLPEVNTYMNVWRCFRKVFWKIQWDELWKSLWKNSSQNLYWKFWIPWISFPRFFL